MENKTNYTTSEVVKVIAEGRNRTNLFKNSEQKFIAIWYSGCLNG